MFSVSLIPVDVGTSVRKQRVVIYARVSTIKEEQESSYELQVDELIKSVESNPSYELVCVYADKESGSNIKNRPSFNRMLELARIGGIAIIYTKSVSRFGRNAIEVPEIIRELRGLGVTVLFDKENISTKDFGNEFLLNILSGVAEEESLQISTNLRWTFSKKMSKGGNTTFSIYGYKIVDNQFHIVPEEADVVRRIYDWYFNHVPYAEMIRRLASLGINSPAGNDHWRSSALERILTSEKYCGDALLGRRRESIRTNKNAVYGDDTKYLVRNNHQGIISHDLFEWVMQERIKRTKHHHRNEPRFVNPESGYFYSVDLHKRFRYKIERPKGKYAIPVLLCVQNGERRMFHYKSIVEGINLVTKELGKRYSDVVNYYHGIKAKNIGSLKSELLINAKTLDQIDDFDDRLDVYEKTSLLQVQKLTLDNLDKLLKGLRSNVNSLLESYSIEKAKDVYSAIYIDGFTVSLIVNLTNSKIEYRKDLGTFVGIKISYSSNYKPCELVFNVVLV